MRKVLRFYISGSYAANKTIVGVKSCNQFRRNFRSGFSNMKHSSPHTVLMLATWALFLVLNAEAQVEIDSIRAKAEQREDIDSLKTRADQGDIEAQCILSYRYAKGIGVEKDEVEGFKWYLKAAEQGEPLSQMNLGFLYYEGRLVPKDNAEAVKWFRKSADQGNAISQCDLGLCYFKGDGVQKDRVEASKWLRKSADQGNARASKVLASIEGKKSKW